MEFELNEEFVKASNMTPEQVTAIKGSVTEYHNGEIAELKKEWDGKSTKDAEAIMDGAAAYITEKTGVKREQGQKIADFITTAWDSHSSSKTSELDKLKGDYEDKLKNFKGDEATAKALLESQTSLDAALKKYADYDTLKEGYDKLEPLQSEYNSMKLRVAYSSVKPNFPDTVNPYEANAKWNEFVSSLEKTHTIEFDGDKPVAVSKENKHSITPLKDLVDKDESIKSLIAGRQQQGTGATGVKELQTIEGVPFQVPKDANSATRSTLIKDYLAKQGMNPMSNNWAAEFAKLNNKILQGTAS